MSGLAEILLKEDFTISGSDAKESALTQPPDFSWRAGFLRPAADNTLPMA